MENIILHPTGAVHIELRGADGEIKEVRDITNMVVGTGRSMIASYLADDGEFKRPNCMGVGTSTTTAKLEQVDLQAPMTPHVVFDKENGVVRNNNSVTYTATFTPGSSWEGAITECAIFYDPAFDSKANADMEMSMLNRTTFAVVNKAAADTLTINWTVTIN